MRLSIAAGLALVALASAPVAAAAPPLRDRFPVEGSFPDSFASVACGVPVTISIAGSFGITVFADRTGQTVREIDTYPGTKLTYSSATGSITIPFSGILHAQYTDGAAIGSTATIELTGNDGPFNDIPGPGSGRLVLTAVVEETNDGVPATRFTGLVSESGDFIRQEQRICAALT